MVLLSHGTIPEQDNNLAYFHGEVKNDVLNIHARYKRWLVRVSGLVQGPEGFNHGLVEPLLDMGQKEKISQDALSL